MVRDEALYFAFASKTLGRFDAALVPTGPAGEVPTHWLLAIEEDLSLRDQVALYGHALGHLLLNREQEKMGQLPQLDPRDGHAHSDMLAELRMLETVRQPLDRRVLETYPLLIELLGVREEASAVIDLVMSDPAPTACTIWLARTVCRDSLRLHQWPRLHSLTDRPTSPGLDRGSSTRWK